MPAWPGLHILALLVCLLPSDRPMSQPLHIDLSTPPPADGGIEDAAPRAATSAPNTPPARPADATCTICLGALQTNEEAEPTFAWPSCHHLLHLSCVANFRAHNANPTCPACRGPWSPDTERRLQHLCEAHGVLLPDPARHPEPHRVEPGPPAPPDTVLPLCCHRILLVDPAQANSDAAWRELPN